MSTVLTTTDSKVNLGFDVWKHFKKFDLRTDSLLHLSSNVDCVLRTNKRNWMKRLNLHRNQAMEKDRNHYLPEIDSNSEIGYTEDLTRRLWDWEWTFPHKLAVASLPPKTVGRVLFTSFAWERINRSRWWLIRIHCLIVSRPCGSAPIRPSDIFTSTIWFSESRSLQRISQAHIIRLVVMLSSSSSMKQVER